MGTYWALHPSAVQDTENLTTLRHFPINALSSRQHHCLLLAVRQEE